MKKFLVLIIFLILSAFLFGNVSAATAFDTSLSFQSDAFYMVNLDTDTVIASKNETKRVSPSAITQIMTMIVAMENITDIEKDTIKVPVYIYDELYGKNVPTADIRSGETIAVRDVLYGLALQNAYEAANILADKYGGGDIKKFVGMMNDKAKELGCKDTNFTNPHGLKDDNQYTTAYDMYLITKHALKIPFFLEISNTLRYTIPPTETYQKDRILSNFNRMIDIYAGSKYYYRYAKGIKTVSAADSGRCTISLATKNAFNYLAVSMNAPYVVDGKYTEDNGSYADLMAAFNYAFDNLQLKTILAMDQPVTEVKLKNGKEKDYVLLYPEKDVVVLLPNNISVNSVQKEVNTQQSLSAPIRQGQELGTASLKLAGAEIASVTLVAGEDISANAVGGIVSTSTKILNSIWFKIAVGVIVLMLVCIGIVKWTIRRKSSRQKYKISKRF